MTLGLAVSLGLGVLGTCFCVWMLVDCATKEPNDGNSNVLWTLIIIITYLIEAALYFFVRRPQRRPEALAGTRQEMIADTSHDAWNLSRAVSVHIYRTG